MEYPGAEPCSAFGAPVCQFPSRFRAFSTKEEAGYDTLRDLPHLADRRTRHSRHRVRRPPSTGPDDAQQPGSAGGLLTIVGLGRTFVSATYASKNAFSRVTATPPGTFVISGRVREPGQGGVLDATVVDRATGYSAAANHDGYFSLPSLPAPQARVGVTVNGYEPRELDANESTDLDAPIQLLCV